jgi:uncharacterized protein (DUF1501 family)
MVLTRRQFFKGGMAAAAGLSLGPHFTRIPGTGVSYAAGPSDAIVVFVQLFGGNDGINTVYPLTGTQRTVYVGARPTLKLPDTNAGMQPYVAAGFGYSTVNDIGSNVDGATYALHPSMGALHQLYGAGRLAVLPGVHYPFADHSHFRSMAIYWSGDPQGAANLGWFGQFMNHAGFASTQVPGVVLGGGISPMFVPTATTVFAFRSLSSLQYPADAERAQRQVAFEQLYGFSSGAAPSLPELVKIGQTGAAGIDRLEDYYRSGSGLANAGRVEALLLNDGNYNRNNSLVYNSPLNDVKLDEMGLATDLRHVAATIRANVGARFFHVGIGGFDTHSNQEQGFWHSWLLYELSESLAAFYGELNQAVSLPGGYSNYLTGNLASKVVIVAFSEFGRTLHQNATDPTAAGTDHATSAPMLVLGQPVIGGQYGRYPALDDPVDGSNGNDLRMTHDGRDVFGTVLTRWLNLPAATLGPGPGKLFPATLSPDDNGDDYTAFTPIPFLPA